MHVSAHRGTENSEMYATATASPAIDTWTWSAQKFRPKANHKFDELEESKRNLCREISRQSDVISSEVRGDSVSLIKTISSHGKEKTEVKKHFVRM